ncbi:unnamed protein product [Pedinophyceae sp. YPF-701]|nr:unnamed protein product [Pedinophyceae sp. YPF-701]
MAGLAGGRLGVLVVIFIAALCGTQALYVRGRLVEDSLGVQEVGNEDRADDMMSGFVGTGAEPDLDSRLRDADACPAACRGAASDAPPTSDTVVALATPLYNGEIDNSFFSSLMGAMERINTNREHPGLKLKVLTVDSIADIAVARAVLVRKFLAVPDATHILFVDNDISFDADVITRLARSGHDVVTRACPKKHWVWPRVVQIAREEQHPVEHLRAMCIDANYEPLEETRPDRLMKLPPGYFKAFNDPEPDGFLPISRAGTGFLMISRRAVEALVERHKAMDFEHPLHGHLPGVFHIHIRGVESSIGRHGEHIGEDWILCDRLRELGFRVMLDTQGASGLTHTGDTQIDATRWWVPYRAGFPAFAKPDAY